MPTATVVHKFGGAALANARAIREVARIVGAQPPGPKVIVVSATGGITDLLIGIAAAAKSGDGMEVTAGCREFLVRHRRIAADLLTGPRRKAVERDVEEIAGTLNAVAGALVALGETSPRSFDHVVSLGELLSARIVAAAIGGTVVDPREVVITSGPHGDATPDLGATARAARRILLPLLGSGRTPVIPGFLGRAPDGSIATLGRGGSDLTATLLGRSLNAARIILWKDVPGLLTSDPRVVPDARLLPLIHPLEAAELAYFGARVLHPRALMPLEGSRVPLAIRPFADPDASGTEVSRRRERKLPPVRSLTSIDNQTLITVTGTALLGVPGMSGRIFAALGEVGVSVSMIVQASSEHTLDFTVPEVVAARAVDRLRRTFRIELESGELDEITARPGVAIVAAVGLGMAGYSGIAARLFDALASASVNVIAIAQGSSEHNISVMIERAAAPAALRQIHAAFQLDKAGGGHPRGAAGMRDIVVLGAGTVGQALLRMIAAGPRGAARLRVVAVVDRSGMILDSEGISHRTLRRIATAKERGERCADMTGGMAVTLNQAVAELKNRALRDPIVVDLTAGETGPLLADLARSGFAVVLANKRPLAGDLAGYRSLVDAASELRYEATVGAGLPTVIAVRQLIESGDRITSLEGALSGTLGLVLTAIEDGIPLSEAVRDAHSRGYTEPDPRDDLSGMDVARKALILARLTGMRIEPDRVRMKPLLPVDWRMPLDRWWKELSGFDAAWSGMARVAKERGEVLRYVAKVAGKQVTVGLQSLPVDHPIGQLRGSANRLVISSERYSGTPLVITGPGAGADVTATGVMADLMALSSR